MVIIPVGCRSEAVEKSGRSPLFCLEQHRLPGSGSPGATEYQWIAKRNKHPERSSALLSAAEGLRNAAEGCDASGKSGPKPHPSPFDFAQGRGEQHAAEMKILSQRACLPRSRQAGLPRPADPAACPTGRLRTEPPPLTHFQAGWCPQDMLTPLRLRPAKSPTEGSGEPVEGMLS